MKRLTPIPVVLALAASLGCAPSETDYDLVVNGGRVIDPESGLDAVRHIGVSGERIAAVSETPLEGAETIDADGLVVAPGFIDLHRHGHTPENYAWQVQDGVTTALELELGVADIPAWYAEREGSRINYGASISHPYSRNLAQLGENPGLEGEQLERELTEEELQKLEALIREGLEAGAVAVGFGIAYTPGVTQEELNRIFAIAAEYDASCHVHMRTGTGDFANLEEVLTAAETSGAALHIVHINSSGGDEALEYVERMVAARERGLDVTTEAYPYNRGSTLIESHLFDDWKSYPDEQFGQYIWVETGETLTRETFGEYREQGGTIISPPSYSMETVAELFAHPLPMVASDGMWLDEGRAHPRSFGTFARILGRFVRERGTLSLLDAIAKMTLYPAMRLEARVPEMADRGRIREGAFADLAVFDLETVIDVGTFDNPARAPEGIRLVTVAGAVTVREGELVEGAAGGKPIRAPQSPGE